jgi:hypothetical protein
MPPPEQEAANMIRIAFIAAGLLGFAGASWADELDKEAPAAKQSPAATSAIPTTGSELDRESPQAAHYWRGGWGYGGYGYHHYGYGGYYRPYFAPVVYRPAFYPPVYYGGYRTYVSVGFGGGYYGPYYGGYGYWW